jgi:hypothetical protein
MFIDGWVDLDGGNYWSSDSSACGLACDISFGHLWLEIESTIIKSLEYAYYYARSRYFGCPWPEAELIIAQN